MELAPKEVPQEKTKRSGNQKLIIFVVLLFLVIGVGFIIRQLGSATTYFYNADEAVAQKQSLGEKRFRLQGTVRPESVQRDADGVRFDVVYHGVTVTVLHQGDPPDLFQPNVPVVLEGHWGTEDFLSDRMLIKHSNEYTEKNKKRLSDAESQAEIQGS